MAQGHGGRVQVLSEILMPNSVGALYSSVTQHLGFREEQEGNTMALASFGTDRFYREIREAALELLDDGRFELRQRATGNGLVYLDRMRRVLAPRERGGPLTQDHYDVAWSCQALSEEIIVHLAVPLQTCTGERRLAVAGGVALNASPTRRSCATRRSRSSTSHRTWRPRTRTRRRPVRLSRRVGGTERRPPAHDYLGRPTDRVADRRRARVRAPAPISRSATTSRRRARG